MTLPAALRVGRKPARRPRSPYTAVGLIPSGARVGGMTSPNLEHLRHLMRRAKDGFPSVDAPFQAREKRWGRLRAWSDAVICPAFDAAGRQPPACMGVRGPGPDHP